MIRPVSMEVISRVLRLGQRKYDVAEGSACHSDYGYDMRLRRRLRWRKCFARSDWRLLAQKSKSNG